VSDDDSKRVKSSTLRKHLLEVKNSEKVIVISILLKHCFKTNVGAPAYLRALNRVRRAIFRRRFVKRERVNKKNFE